MYAGLSVGLQMDIDEIYDIKGNLEIIIPMMMMMVMSQGCEPDNFPQKFEPET